MAKQSTQILPQAGSDARNAQHEFVAKSARKSMMQADFVAACFCHSQFKNPCAYSARHTDESRYPDA